MPSQKVKSRTVVTQTKYLERFFPLVDLKKLQGFLDYDEKILTENGQFFLEFKRKIPISQAVKIPRNESLIDYEVSSDEEVRIYSEVVN